MNQSSRYLAAYSRRQLLVRSLAAGALVVLPACGTSDKAAFTPSSGDTGIGAPAASEPPGDTVAPSAAGVTSSGEPWPGGAEMAIDFTFASTMGGPTRNPYIAVWVEDPDGNLIKTVALWVEQSFKAERYIHEMRGWYDLTGGDLTMSTATRVAGQYSLLWDGMDDEGNAVQQGEYVVRIEAAREHGPYELVSQTVTVGSESFDATADDQGEVSNVSLRYSV